MRLRSRWLKSGVVVGAAVSLGVALAIPSGSAVGSRRTEFGGLPGLARTQAAAVAAGGESKELIDRAAQYAQVRTAPATSVSPLAFAAARRQAAALPAVGGRWTQLTDGTFQNDDARYRDPFWSNSGSGWGLTTGRTTALAVDGPRLWLGAADGGVWRSTDRGQHWTPVFDRQDKLSIGAVAVNPADHSVWVGTGEANTNQDAYNGTGVFRSGDGGATWRLVGNRLGQYLVYRLTFDGHGYVYAATSRGLLKRSTIDLTNPWRVVLKPDPNPNTTPYRTSHTTDVRVRPGTNGREVLAAIGWRGGTLPSDLNYNGFYYSTDAGAHFRRLTLQGDLAGNKSKNIGRTTFNYSADGKVLYAVVERTTDLTLKGVYMSASGDARGPWTRIADAAELSAAGSTLGSVGVQAWYNQDIAVDPNNKRHVYVDLEEVFETTDAGGDWNVTGHYWNFGRPCYQGGLDDCPMTTHPDQHAIALDPASGIGYFGNDGGLYSRRISDHSEAGWTNLNADLHTLQYYFAGIGKVPGGDAVWGGTQDNGDTLKLPARSRMVSPAGGDGGDFIVDPNNGNRAVGEYVYLNMYSTTNGGRSDGSTRSFRTISPSCLNVEFTVDPCDPAPRFISPFEADVNNVNHWVAGGEFVWDNKGKGWSTECTDQNCDWKRVHDTGAGNASTAIAAVGNVTYVGWCGTGNGCNPGLGIPFQSGIDTNYGGRWHRVHAPVLPNRIITDLVVDPAHPGHVVATYGGFSRHWIAGGGKGHVFESWDGGAHWSDLSGNLPDISTGAGRWWRGKLVVATDVGVFTMIGKGQWARLGIGLPNAATNDLVISSTQGYLLAATHGRGLWKLQG